MITPIDKFREKMSTFFAHRGDGRIIVSSWETIPCIDEAGDEVIIVGLTKFDLTQDELDKLPSEIDGVKLVYEYRDEITFLGSQAIAICPLHLGLLSGEWESNKGKYDPIIGGVSFGAIDISAGTLANIVWDKDTGEPYFLTNEHVVSDTQNTNPAHPPIGHPIVQPGPLDGGTLDDVAGTLHAVGGMKASALSNQSCNIDSAIVIPTRTFLERTFWGIGEIELKAHVEAVVGDVVTKTGRTTGVTESTVFAVGVSANVGGLSWGDPVAMIDLIHTKPGDTFVQGGDSGSRVWKKSTMEPLGIVFAGSTESSFLIKAQNICDTFNVTFEGGGDAGVEIEIDGEVIVTDEYGKASILLKPDDYLYNVLYSRFQTHTDTVGVEQSPTTITVNLYRDVFLITFTVIDNVNKLPVAGATVSVGGQVEVTDEFGVCAISLPWKDTAYTWTVSKDFHHMKSESFTVIDANINIPIELERFGVLSIDSPDQLQAGETDTVIELSIVGAEFTEEADIVANWNINHGGTGLTVGYIELIDDHTVHISTYGAVVSGSMSLQAKAEAVDVGVATNVKFLNVVYGTVLFEVRHEATKLNNAEVTLASYGTQITDSNGNTTFDDVLAGVHAWGVQRTGFTPQNGNIDLGIAQLKDEYYYSKARLWFMFSNQYTTAWQEIRFNQTATIIGVNIPIGNFASYTLLIYDSTGNTLLGSYDQGSLVPTHVSGGIDPYIHFCPIPAMNVSSGDTYLIGYALNPAGYIPLARLSEIVEPARWYNGDIWRNPNGFVWVNGSLVYNGDLFSKYVMDMGFVTNEMYKFQDVNLSL